MDPIIKEKWLTALRSGEFQKGIGALKRRLPEGKFSHCCIGILCEVVDPDGFQENELLLHNPIPFRKTAIGCPDTDFLESVQISDRAVDRLIRMNDGEGYSFLDIANRIQENL